MDTINPRLIKIQRLYNKIVSSTQEDIDRRLSVMYMLERMDHEASNVTIHPRVLTAHKVIDRSLTEAKVEHQTYRFQNQDLSGVTLVLQNLRFKDSDDTTTGVIHLFSNGKFTYVQFGVFYALPSVLTAQPFNKNPIPKLNRILEKHGLDLAVVHKGKTVKVAINGLIVLSNESTNELNIMLTEPAPFEIKVGDPFLAIPGCNHTMAACAKKGNQNRFGGFPAIPGTAKVNRIYIKPGA